MANKKVVKGISWKKYLQLINTLARKIKRHIKKENIKLDGIVGVSRGGLIIAVILSHKLNLPMLDEVYLSNKLLFPLIVDDICDTGKTIQEYDESMSSGQDYLVATLHYKEEAEAEPNIYVEKIYANVNVWIKYPYEIKVNG